MRTILQDFLARLPRAGWGLRLVWSAAPRWTLAWAALLLLQAVLPVAQVLLIRNAVNHLAPAPELNRILLPAAAVGLLWILGQSLSALMAWIRSAQAEYVQDRIQDLIHSQALNLDLAFYDRPENYDLLHRAQADAAAQPLALLESLGALAQNGLTLLALAAVLASYAGWLPFLLLASALPGVWTMARQILREHRWRQAHTTEIRKADYYDGLLTDPDAAAELRLFALGPHHRAAFQQLRAHLREGRLALAWTAVKAELGALLLAWTGSLAGLGWMLRQTLQGQARLGDLVLCYQAFQQGQTLLLTLLESTGKVYRSLLYMENLQSFLERVPSIPAQTGGAAPAFPLAEGIRYEGVGFHYPGSDIPALQDFDLHLPAGRVTALVGPNGAGKSTLIKLLCRFYDPQQGRILVDGRDLRELDLPAYHRGLAVLFQEPVRYHASAAENIGLGDVTALADRAGIERAARAAGADAPILRLPEGFGTLLGRWFGGHELSTGEWQRIALARACFRQAALVVLDEPTSAMDSWAELDWLTRFRALTEGRTALMITHRFTTAMHADHIHVLSAGRIVQSGTHAELVQAKGPYADSWTAQMAELGRG